RSWAGLLPCTSVGTGNASIILTADRGRNDLALFLRQASNASEPDAPALQLRSACLLVPKLLFGNGPSRNSVSQAPPPGARRPAKRRFATVRSQTGVWEREDTRDHRAAPLQSGRVGL